MSLDLPAGVVPCPIASGLHFTENPNDPDGFYYIMYRHNDGFTWFAGTTRKRPRLLPDGHYAHYIKSTVQGDRIPGKHDLVVAACNYDHLVTYHALEMHWWRDFGTEKTRLDEEWRDQFYPGIPLARLFDQVPKIHKLKASKHAHRMVARREGREDQLPVDFDQVQGEEAMYSSEEE